MHNNTFPFSAIIGQERLKLALTLCSINPKIGGVLLSGTRGTAKSTLARAMLALISRSEGSGHFVTLPLSASEERICGTLDLEKVLDDGSVAFAPGLLHKAHRGILYVDEVNLLADNLVDLLLDVAASGMNTVERDAISHQHPAEFILLGTMNPEEGELRPQLLDRFGLCVAVNDDYSLQERIDIVRARLAYETAPVAFIDQYSEQQAQLIARCEAARQRLASVTVSDQLVGEITRRCQCEGVEGVRADIVIYRAACAHAALSGRCVVDATDIEAVAEFALWHRRRAPPPHSAHPPTQSPPPTGESLLQSSRESQPGNSTEGDWGTLPPVPMHTGAQRTLNARNSPAKPAGKKKQH